jgi:hypothetical protein
METARLSSFIGERDVTYLRGDCYVRFGAGGGRFIYLLYGYTRGYNILRK